MRLRRLFNGFMDGNSSFMFCISLSKFAYISSENFENEFLEITRQEKIANIKPNEESLLKIPKEFETAEKKNSDLSSTDWDGYSFRMLAVVCCVMLFTRLSGNLVLSLFLY